MSAAFSSPSAKSAASAPAALLPRPSGPHSILNFWGEKSRQPPKQLLNFG